ncbi:hypothetical protein [Pedobacter antarcticus]|uniref:Zinc-finger domain-containing protein n=2 Tax=Pedobacter antarcticus TaxID=34086 RepID=A0A081PE89_9SPHI|nr:hypothetical protein [Pedobacter antarcticus]KEQ29012.1 hypothetical protein N180_13965 [Pedobacter antarcticus 4BY]SDL51993.1 hypothetical protein SAMN04488084_101559 [Pedobacter antarcticus]SFE30204.1 hypothetical protein SAMN03003324_00016 [Pedobacter antarcticus]
MKKVSDQDMAEMVNNCKKATFLIEKRQTGNITLKETLELEFHLKGCEMCNIFMKQSLIINQFVKKLFNPRGIELKLDDQFKEQLQKQVDTKLDQSLNED